MQGCISDWELLNCVFHITNANVYCTLNKIEINGHAAKAKWWGESRRDINVYDKF